MMMLSKTTQYMFFMLFCTAAVFAQSNDAASRLEETLSGVAAPVQTARGGTRPGWTSNPYSTLSRDRYLAAVGTAANRAEAEKRAFVALITFFGQSVRSDYTVATTYSEAVTNNKISFSENTNVQEIIVTAASLDTLIGAEIGNVWDDGRGTIYALAFIEREKAVAVYTEIIRMNQQNINNLLAMSAAEKNTFNGYARYKLASLIAGLNANYAVIVSLAGNSNIPFNLSNADALSLEASNIIRNISVGFNVRGDNNNRIRDAFARVLSNEGLRTQGSNTPYILEVSIEMSEAVFPGNNYIYCRYTVSANLVERATGSTLIPFNVSDREGHTTYESAQSRVFLSIERIIAERYSALFKEYLAALLPR